MISSWKNLFVFNSWSLALSIATGYNTNIMHLRVYERKYLHWNEWSQWSSCAHGIVARKRKKSPEFIAAHNTYPSNQLETRQCMVEGNHYLDQRAGSWGIWSEWSLCSNDTRKRISGCMSKQHHNKEGFKGEAEESKPCKDQSTLSNVTRGKDSGSQKEFVCPVGFEHSFVNKSGSFSCYYISTKAETKDRARNDCVRIGGDLVSIETEEEQRHLSRVLSIMAGHLHGSNGFVWTSGFQRKHGKVLWYNLRHSYPISYTNWARLNPLTLGYLDVIMSLSKPHEWTNSPPSSLQKFGAICEANIP